MARALELHPDHLFPAEPATHDRARTYARELTSGFVRRAYRIDEPLFTAHAV